MFCGVPIVFCIWHVQFLWPKWWHWLSVRYVSCKSSTLKCTMFCGVPSAFCSGRVDFTQVGRLHAEWVCPCSWLTSRGLLQLTPAPSTANELIHDLNVENVEGQIRTFILQGETVLSQEKSISIRNLWSHEQLTKKVSCKVLRYRVQTDVHGQPTFHHVWITKDPRARRNFSKTSMFVGKANIGSETLRCPHSMSTTLGKCHGWCSVKVLQVLCGSVPRAFSMRRLAQCALRSWSQAFFV